MEPLPAALRVRGELVVNRWGLMWEAVGTSSNLPILGPPFAKGDRLLIDGSLVDNLPVEVTSSRGEGPVIAVDVKASFRRPGAKGAATSEPAAREPVPEARAPGLLETLARVLLLGSSNTSKAATEHADWVITPQNEGVGLLEFHQLELVYGEAPDRPGRSDGNGTLAAQRRRVGTQRWRKFGNGTVAAVS